MSNDLEVEEIDQAGDNEVASLKEGKILDYIDLLIEHGIGVRKRTVELLEVDPDGFQVGDLEA